MLEAYVLMKLLLPTLDKKAEFGKGAGMSGQAGRRRQARRATEFEAPRRAGPACDDSESRYASAALLARGFWSRGTNRGDDAEDVGLEPPGLVCLGWDGGPKANPPGRPNFQLVLPSRAKSEASANTLPVCVCACVSAMNVSA